MAKQNRRIIAYLRVSTNNQDLEKNKADIRAFCDKKGFGMPEWIEEKVSGKVKWTERKLGTVFLELNKGDIIVVSEMSRLGRSMLEIMEIMNKCVEKGVQIYAIKGDWVLNGTIQSKVMAMVFSIASEIERDLISKRVTEGLKARKAKGLPMGRPKGSGSSKLDKYKTEIKGMLSIGVTQKRIAEKYNTTPGNLNVWMKKNKIDKNKLGGEDL